MNTARMTAFLDQVSAAHRRDFIIMVVDGASSYVAKDLAVPKNIRLLRLPPYAPELNPQEHVWDELREKEFPNRVYAHMASVRAQLETGLPRLAGDHRALTRISSSVPASNPFQNRRRVLFCTILPDEVTAIEHEGARSGQGLVQYVSVFGGNKRIMCAPNAQDRSANTRKRGSQNW